MNSKDKRNPYRHISRALRLIDSRNKIDDVIKVDPVIAVKEPTLAILDEKRTANNGQPIPAKFQQLDKFFHGMLTYGDVIRFADHELTDAGYDTRYAALTDAVTTPPQCGIVMLWQWAETSPVFSLYMPAPVIKNKIKDFLPTGYLAQRMAIMAMTDEHVSINLVYMLTGVISQHDPIHEEIRKHGY